MSGTAAAREEVTGAVMGFPQFLRHPTGLAEWDVFNGTWKELEEHWFDKRASVAQVDTRAALNWEAQSKKVFGRNEQFLLAFTLHEPSGAGDEQKYDIYFGKRWRLTLRGPDAPGKDSLTWELWSTKDANGDAYLGSQLDLALRAQGKFLSKEEFYGRPWLVHVIPDGANFLILRTNKRLNTLHYGVSPQTTGVHRNYDPAGKTAGRARDGDIVVFVPPSDMNLVSPVAGVPEFAAEWEITAPSNVIFKGSGGAAVLAWRPVGFPRTFKYTSSEVDIGYGTGFSTQPLNVTFRPLGAADTTRYEWVPRQHTHAKIVVERLNALPGDVWRNFRYSLEGTVLDSGPGTGFTPFVYAVGFQVDPTYTFSGNPLDITPFVTRLQFRASLQRDSDSMELEFFDREGSAFFYSKRNQLGRAVHFLTATGGKFLGRVKSVEYDHAGFSPKAKISCGRFGAEQVRNFRFAYQTENFSGTDIAYAINQILKYAGIPANRRAQIAAQAGDLTLPVLPIGGGATADRFMPQPNTTAAEILDEIMTSFASDWELLEDGDGNWTLNRRSLGSAHRTFHSTTAAARAAPDQNADYQMRTLTEKVDDSAQEYFNEVYVMGISYGEDAEVGTGLVVGYDYDRRSWEDDTYEFFVGERRTLFILNPSIPTKALAQKVARTMLHHLKQFKRTFAFRADWDPALTGKLGKRLDLNLVSPAGGTSTVGVRLLAMGVDIFPSREECDYEADTRFVNEETN
jgi:hypothetical protein